jgi:hypothetical protein
MFFGYDWRLFFASAPLRTSFMNIRLTLVCLSITAANAMAADANNPPSAPATASAQSSAAAKPIAPRRILAPTISETRATRMPDGSLAVTCVDTPNPKVRALQQHVRSPQLNPDQQP